VVTSFAIVKQIMTSSYVGPNIPFLGITMRQGRKYITDSIILSLVCWPARVMTSFGDKHSLY